MNCLKIIGFIIGLPFLIALSPLIGVYYFIRWLCCGYQCNCDSDSNSDVEEPPTPLEQRRNRQQERAAVSSQEAVFTISSGPTATSRVADVPRSPRPDLAAQRDTLVQTSPPNEEELLEHAISAIFEGQEDEPIDIYAEMILSQFLEPDFDASVPSSGPGTNQELRWPSGVSTIEVESNSTIVQTTENDQQNPECSICWEKPKDRIMIPCGHCFCDSCSQQIETCAICRRPIQGKTAIRLIDMGKEIREAARRNVLTMSEYVDVPVDILEQQPANDQVMPGPDPECSECSLRPKSVMLMPCGHGFCKSCSDKMGLNCVQCDRTITSKNAYHFDV